MSLSETQNLLVRLYTDADLRRRFLADAETIGRENNLTEQEIAEIARLLPAELNSFAETLFRKRLGAVEKTLSLTRKALGRKFELCFREFDREFHSASDRKHIALSIAFARFLESKTLEPAWAIDAARFESAQLEFYGLSRKFVVRSFDQDIRLVIEGIYRGNLSLDFERRKTRAVWLRIGKQARHFVW